MSQVFEAPIFSYLNQRLDQIDIFPDAFTSGRLADVEGVKFLEVPAEGMTFRLDEQLAVHTIFLYGDGMEGFRQYQLPLPAGLLFSMSRSDVREYLGEPNRNGDPLVDETTVSFAWDRYESDLAYFHLRYTSGNQQIQLITIGSIPVWTAASISDRP
jgi:hypothetical protein